MSEQVEEYREAVTACALACRLLQQHDIPKLLRDIENADATGPIFNPTLWIQKNTAMEEDRKLLSAALVLRNAMPPAKALLAALDADCEVKP